MVRASITVALIVGALAWSARAPADDVKPTTSAAKPTRTTPGRAASSPYKPVAVSNRARDFYQSIWGVDNLLVRETASGNLIRFSYRVIDPARAKALAEDRATPVLYGQRSHAVLHVPVMDKVGQLRQTGALVAGQDYWMVFSNSGRPIKVGDRVNVVIGDFHADGLKVE